MSNITYSRDPSTPLSEPSLCIPRVFANVTENRIIRCWELLLGADGVISRVDMIQQHDQQDNYDYWRVFIHFNEWPDTPSSNEIRTRILQGETCKVVYDDPWWWNVSASRRPKPRHKNGVRPPPYLVRPDPMEISMPPPQHEPPALTPFSLGAPALTPFSLGPPAELKKNYGYQMPPLLPNGHQQDVMPPMAVHNTPYDPIFPTAVPPQNLTMSIHEQKQDCFSPTSPNFDVGAQSSIQAPNKEALTASQLVALGEMSGSPSCSFANFTAKIKEDKNNNEAHRQTRGALAEARSATEAAVAAASASGWH